jgi:hypothetical protein
MLILANPPLITLLCMGQGPKYIRSEVIFFLFYTIELCHIDADVSNEFWGQVHIVFQHDI